MQRLHRPTPAMSLCAGRQVRPLQELGPQLQSCHRCAASYPCAATPGAPGRSAAAAAATGRTRIVACRPISGQASQPVSATQAIHLDVGGYCIWGELHRPLYLCHRSNSSR